MAPAVLIVDDDVSLRWQLCQHLDRLGFDCDSAASAKEAIERLEKNSYRIILMDVIIPDMDVHELIKTIRTREQELSQKPVPIIGVGEQDHEQMYAQYGMSDCIYKPVDPLILQALVSKWIIPGNHT